MKWESSRSVAENAARILPELLDKYVARSRHALGAKASPKKLHRFRVATKKFRYTIELFLPVYGDRLDRELEAVRDLQRVLGKLHDYYVIGKMLEDDQALRQKLQELLEKKMKEFNSQWRVFGSKAHLKRWKRFLASSGRSAPKSGRRGAPKSGRRQAR